MYNIGIYMYILKNSSQLICYSENHAQVRRRWLSHHHSCVNSLCVQLRELSVHLIGHILKNSSQETLFLRRGGLELGDRTSSKR